MPIFLILINISDAKASHIVGGEFNYEYLGNDSFFVKIKVYRDQINANPGATFDDPLRIYVYDENDNYLYTRFVNRPPNFVLVPVIDDPCFVEPPRVITEVIAYEAVIYIPGVKPGYKFSYMRCCRNNDILNIESVSAYDGDTTDASLTGANYPAYISEVTLENGNPEFNKFPPLAICVNEPLVFDHSATDPDGDSLVYKICTPFTGGFGNSFDPNDVFGDPVLQAPPFQEVLWIPPYGLDNVMGGTPMAIDPQTGLLTAIPSTIGRFVVAICVEEYRDGVFLAEHRRDFQFNIVDCGKFFEAGFEFEGVPKIDTISETVLLLCDTTTSKQFTSTDDEDADYFWSFGDGSTSTEQNPFHTFPSNGTYQVMQVVGAGQVCADTLIKTVKIERAMIGADFDYEVGALNNNEIPVQFDDNSDASEPIVSWSWQFGDGENGMEQNPLHYYEQQDTFDVTLFIYAENGCCDQTTKQLYFPIIEECEIGEVFIPNAFSPNNDGLNDLFRPKSTLISEMEMEIYDRWGNLVFEGTDIATGWDGRLDGKDLPADTYGYMIRLYCLGGASVLKKGNLTLVR
ncbi:MAG: PKD domain-containing protein [Chitinophagales bacterium]